MNTLSGQKTQILHAARRVVPFMADSTATAAKDLPSQIELIKAGTWPASSVKGPLTIPVSDLHEMAANFNVGIGLPGGGHIGLPIDFSHEEWSQAAGWINSVEVVGDTLVANVTWTAEGAEALLGGMYKCVSPSFYPACMGEWYDPEDSDVTARNVLVGAGLTNIPFFKDLKPLMASNTSNSGGKTSKNVIYVNADERKINMQLDELRVKDATSLTDEEKAFVAEHKAELSAEEQTKFGVAEAPEEPETPETPEEPETPETPEAAEEVAEAVALQASVKNGDKVVMAAADVKAMTEKIDAHAKQLDKYREAEVTASVTKHLERGAIKADQVKNWTSRILADATVEDLLKTLPNNKVAAGEIGASNAADTSAYTQLKDKAEKISADRKLTYGAGLQFARKENPELARQADQEIKEN